MGGMGNPPPEPVIADLDEVWSATAEGCSGLREDEWDRATDCPGWSVKDQLSHLIGIERALLGEVAPPLAGPVPPHVRNPIGEINEGWIEARRPVPGDAVLEEFVEVTRRRLDDLSASPPERFDVVGWSPVGDVPYREFMEVRVFDSWVHEQDARRALGRPGDRFGRGEAVTLSRMVGALPYIIGRQVAPPDGTTVVVEITGPTGRRVAVGVEGKRARQLEAAPGDPDVTLTLDAMTFWRLCCGRVPPDQALDGGEVEVGGDAELARRVVGAMNIMV